MIDPSSDQGDPRRAIPRTDVLLAQPEFVAAARRLGDDAVRTAIQHAQQKARTRSIAPEDVAAEALGTLTARLEEPTTLRQVLNATGVVLHTNIGRAPLSPAAREAAGGRAVAMGREAAPRRPVRPRISR